MPWLPASVLNSGGNLDYTLSGTPDPTWGSSPDAGPPSSGSARSRQSGSLFRAVRRP